MLKTLSQYKKTLVLAGLCCILAIFYRDIAVFCCDKVHMLIFSLLCCDTAPLLFGLIIVATELRIVATVFFSFFFSNVTT